MKSSMAADDCERLHLSAGAQFLISAQAAPGIQDVGVNDGTGAEPWLLTAADHTLIKGSRHRKDAVGEIDLWV